MLLLIANTIFYTDEQIMNNEIHYNSNNEPAVNIKQQFKMLYFKHNRASCIGVMIIIMLSSS